MPTIVVRGLDPQVVEVLKARAAAEGKSLSAYVVGELSRIAAVRSNADIVTHLRHQDRSGAPTAMDILEALHTGRR